MEDDAEMLEKRVGGVDVRLVSAEDFRRLAEYWIDAVGDRSAELPLPIFHGAGELNLETAYQMIDQEFA